MTTLLAGNVLVAALTPTHVHHRAATAWFSALNGRFATCPITQGTLLRLLLRAGVTAADAQAVLAEVTGDGRHEFWPDAIAYTDVRLSGVIGHRQITDAYLAQITRAHNGRLASFDQGLAKLHDDVVDLVPTAEPAPPPPRRPTA